MRHRKCAKRGRILQWCGLEESQACTEGSLIYTTEHEGIIFDGRANNRANGREVLR